MSLNDFFGKTHDRSEVIEALLVVDEFQDWEVPWAAGRPEDVAWLYNSIKEMSAKDVLQCKKLDKDLAPGKYRIKLKLSWQMHPSTPDRAEEYDEEVEILSVNREA